MAWNQPTGAAQPPRKAPSKLRGLVAFLILVALAGGAAWYLFMPKAEKKAERGDDKTRLIKDVGKTNAVKKVVEKRELTAEDKRLARIAEIKAKWGDNPPPGLRTRLYYLEHPPRIHLGQKNPYAFLRHPSERQLAIIASIPPGSEMIEPIEFSSSFNQDFVNCMMDDIPDSKDDTEKERELKQLVRETKKELMEVCKKEGKLPADVMNEYAKTLFDLGRFAQDLDEEISKMRNNPDVSDADVADYVRAANIMREKKGLEPMPIPSLKGRARFLKYKQEINAKRAANKAAKAAEAAEKAKEEAK